MSSACRPCNRPGAFQVVTRVTRPLQQQNCITERVVRALLSTVGNNRSMGSNIQRFVELTEARSPEESVSLISNCKS